MLACAMSRVGAPVTYHIVLDPVDLWICEADLCRVCNGLACVLDLVVLDTADLEYSDLFECPFCELLGKFSVHSLGALSIWGLNGGIKPGVLQHVKRAQYGESG